MICVTATAPLRSRLTACCVLFLLACASDNGTGPEVQAPVISIQGVTDAASYNVPVIPVIQVDRGSYEATLNGQPFISGRTVSDPGAYTLVVTARNGAQTATKQVTFTIAAPPGGTLIVRLFDLGAQASGGGGDAILVTDSSAGGMVHALIDAGPASGSTNDTTVSRRLDALNVDTLAFMLLTHAHADHYSGMSNVLAASM